MGEGSGGDRLGLVVGAPKDSGGGGLDQCGPSVVARDRNILEVRRDRIVGGIEHEGLDKRVARRIAVIDHGTIVAQGTPAELKAQTGTESLEQAFLALTGTSIRDERADPAAQMRQFAKMWRR